MRARVLVLCWLGSTLLLACGTGAERTEEATEEAPSHAEPGRLVLVEAALDHDVLELGQAAIVRRVYANVGGDVVRVAPGDWGARGLGEVVLKATRSHGLYELEAGHLGAVVLEPGERTENQVHVELPGPGSYTIEIPPEYVVRGRGDPCFQLPVLVVDRGDDRFLAEKAERLARVIEGEDPDFPTCWTESQSDLQAMGKAAAPHLRRWLRESESAHLRAIAAKLLGAVKAVEGVEDLVAGLGDPAPDVRKMCLSSLAGFRKQETLGAMLPLVRDPDVWVRVEAVEAIAGFDDPRVVPAMRVLLEDDDLFARRWAAYHLADDKKDASGIHVLLEALRSDPVSEGWMAVTALETLVGKSFGDATMPFAHSGLDGMEQAAEENRLLARRWLEWWDDEGRARFGDR